jgi:hypothetical protein
MSTQNSQSCKNGQTGVFILLLVIVLLFALTGGRHFFHNTGRDIRTTAQDAGHDLKSTGRDAAASIRDTVQ